MNDTLARLVAHLASVWGTLLLHSYMYTFPVCVQVCEVLLKNGAEMNEADKKYGWTAVMLAIQNK